MTALRRLAHSLAYRDEYRTGPDGLVYERCVHRWSGRLVGVKASEPGDRPNFQPVGGA
jgi:hypothetical protein